MPFYVVQSNRSENIGTHIADVMRSQPLPPFNEEIIVVRNKGMERWLTQFIAEKCGVAANISFPFPRSFIFSVIHSMLHETYDLKSFSREQMTWRILKKIHTLDSTRTTGRTADAVFDPLRTFLNESKTSDALSRRIFDRKCYSLSAAIADVFDDYMAYRPEMLLDCWAHGKTTGVDSLHEGWQAELWRMLCTSENCLKNPVEAALECCSVRINPDETKIPKRIFVCGISKLPELYFTILRNLGNYSDVYFYYFNPSEGYWGDIQSQREKVRNPDLFDDSAGEISIDNELLADWGRSGREFLQLIVDSDSGEGKELFSPPKNDTLLHTIQSQIYAMGAPELPDSAREDTKSVQFHSCHSAMREVEVLYDHLLAACDADATLTPRDIIVMTPDIETYAPFIDAVFGCAETKIPYTIANRVRKNNNSVAHYFLRIVQLPFSQWRAREILDVFSSEPVRRKFSIEDDADISRIRFWLEQAHICWGINGAFKEECGVPEVEQNTWEFGIRRLLAGYAAHTNNETYELTQDIAPVDGIEGGDADVLGHFLSFIDALKKMKKTCTHDHTRKEWSDILLHVLQTFFIEDENYRNEIQEIRQTVSDDILRDNAEENTDDEWRVSFDIITAWLNDALNSVEEKYGFMSGGVTFCSLVPMRSIPFRIICVLGMNDMVFPRQDVRPDFDLMRANPRASDPSQRNEDIYLFLETLLSAREKLYISYIGRSSMDNSEKNPSVLVQQLWDYIDEMHGYDDNKELPHKKYIIEHPLQPFNPRYFNTEEPKLFSYSKQNCAAAEALLGTPVAPTLLQPDKPLSLPNVIKVISRNELQTFFRNPAKYFLESQVKIRTKLYEDGELEDNEPFSLEYPESYTIPQALLEAEIQGKDIEALRTWYKAEGVLPPGAAGARSWKDAREKIQECSAKVREICAGKEITTHPIDIEIDDVKIFGRVPDICDTIVVHTRPAELNGKDVISAWIDYCLCIAGGVAMRADIVTVNKKIKAKIDHTEMQGLTSEQARTELKKFLHLYIQGLQQPLPFFPKTSYEYACRQTYEYYKVKNAWQGGFSGMGESEDASFSGCFGTSLKEISGFEKTAHAVFDECITCMTNAKKK